MLVLHAVSLQPCAVDVTIFAYGVNLQDRFSEQGGGTGVAQVARRQVCGQRLSRVATVTIVTEQAWFDTGNYHSQSSRLVRFRVAAGSRS